MQHTTPGRSVEQTITRTLDACRGGNDRLHAFAAIAGDVALVEARHRDALTAHGVNLGPLHGVPIVIKDIIDVAGMPTRAGSATRPDPGPAHKDAFVVRQLRAAGAIVVGKAHTVEFAFGGWGTNASQGTPVNPWAKDAHTPGGSSSGTGVAVGAGLVPAGLGTDTGGSVRIPAAFCGCVGLKTSMGMVSRSGVVPLSDTLDSVGPLTDTVRRAAEMLDAMQGEDRDDPSTVGVRRGDPLRDLDRGISAMTFGRLTDECLDHMTPEVAEAFDHAANLMADAGARIVPFTMPRAFLDFQQFATRIISSDAYTFHGALAGDAASLLNPTTRMRMNVATTLNAVDRVTVQRTRAADTVDFLALMDRVDALILPTAPFTAQPVTHADEDDYRMSLYTRFANYFGLASLSVPVSLDGRGMPTAIQIAVRNGEDPLALRIGAALEAARGPFPRPQV